MNLVAGGRGGFMPTMRFRLEHRRYRVPFRAPVRTAHGAWAEREGVLVRLATENGKCGVGEAAPIPWFGTESIEEIEATLAVLGEWVDAQVLEQVPERLGCLRFALRGALRTAMNEEGERSVHAYLPVAALLPAGRAALATIPAKAELGFRTFKWKVGVEEISDDLALLDDVIAALPDGAKLRLDANGAWNTRQACRWLERAADRPVEFVEQPCFADAKEGDSARRRVEDALRGLADDFPTPIGLDESLVGAQDVARWTASGWRGVYIVKPALLGDPVPVLARLAQARADVVFSSALETAVGARAALEAAFAWKVEKPRALGFGVWPLFGEPAANGPVATPFFRNEEVMRMDAEAVWNALT